MRAVTSLVAVVALAAAVTSACGQSAARTGAAGSASATAASPGTPPSTAPASSVPASSVPASPVSGGCQSGGAITVGTGDNGKTLCVKQGTGVKVILLGTLARKWTPIQVSSTALAPRPNGGLTLVVGATGAYFMAAHAGTSVVSSARPACTGATSGGPVSTSPPGPGGVMHCNVLQAFRVTVVVSG